MERSLTALPNSGLFAAQIEGALNSPAPLRALFVDALKWEPSRASVAKRGAWAVIESDGRTPPAGQVISGRAAAGSVELAFPLPHGRFSVLTLRSGRLTESALQSLARLAVPAGAVMEDRELAAPSSERMMQDFLGETQQIIERHVTAVGSAAPLAKPLHSAEQRRILTRWAMRLVCFRLMEEQGWLAPGWLRRQAESTSDRPIPARLASAWSLGVCSGQSAEADRLAPLVGRVPALGLRFALLEPGENQILAPDAFLQEMIAGPLSRAAWSAFEPAPGSEAAAVTPEALGRLARPEAKPIWREEPAPPGAVFDPEAGAGGRLVQTLLQRLGALQGRERIKAARVILTSELQGSSETPEEALAARLRLAWAAWAGCAEPALAPDLEHVIRIGAPQVTAGAGRLEEGQHAELKGSFEWSPREGARSDSMRLGSLRTIAGFLNSEGGVLWLGVDDQGRPVGLEGDLGGGPDRSRLDRLEMRIREALKKSLDPAPIGAVDISFPRRSGVIVGRIDVRPVAGITYLLRQDERSGRSLEEIYVRDGARTLRLEGRMRDRYVVERLGGRRQ